MKALFFVLAFGLFLLSGCVQEEQGKYFEVVLQDPACGEGLCFDEKLATDDGLVFLKQRNPEDSFGVSFCKADSQKLNSLFAFLDQKFSENRFASCTGCKTMHLFYNNGKGTKSSSIPFEQATFEKEFYEMASGICSESTEAELIHFVSGKVQGYEDYHIFSNNKVVFERFGLRDGELLDSKVSKISGKEFAELKATIPKEFFSSASLNNCPANGYFYGYVEALIDGENAEAFTCGDGSPAGAAFLGLAGRLSK